VLSIRHCDCVDEECTEVECRVTKKDINLGLNPLIDTVVKQLSPVEEENKEEDKEDDKENDKEDDKDKDKEDSDSDNDNDGKDKDKNMKDEDKKEKDEKDKDEKNKDEKDKDEKEKDEKEKDEKEKDEKEKDEKEKDEKEKDKNEKNKDENDKQVVNQKDDLNATKTNDTGIIKALIEAQRIVPIDAGDLGNRTVNVTDDQKAVNMTNATDIANATVKEDTHEYMEDPDEFY